LRQNQEVLSGIFDKSIKIEMNRIIQNTLLGIGSAGMITGMTNCKTGINRESDIARPNIIFILADDLGYGELGCFGQTDIETPNLDQLAAEGMIFTNHYTGSPVCAPARCILLTGFHSGKAQIRGNDEMPERGDVWDYHAMLADPSLEGQRPLKEGTVTIGTLLQSAGYKTAVIGKWGLGPPFSEGSPDRQGFDYFYGSICQRQAHTFYPVHLWENDQRIYLNNDTVPPHDWLREDVDPYDPESYDAYNLNDYSPDFMFEKIIRFVDENASVPFFLYWADLIPHLPLQAPKRWVDYYVDKFGDEEPYAGVEGYNCCNYFPVRYPHATYAAMISYLDENVGKLVRQLKDLGVYNNTLIIFTSDNGPTRQASVRFNSAGPFNQEFGKGHLNEGGIRVPMIASWPEVIEPGSVTDHISVFYDVMPTLADIVNVKTPDDISGRSFLPALKGKKQEQPEYLYWEFPERGGQMAVRLGNLKALRKNMHNGNLKWELFDLDKDPMELDDISSRNPEIIDRVEAIVAREHVVSHNEIFRFSILNE
jgi:arylsulfatase A-like enzyme